MSAVIRNIATPPHRDSARKRSSRACDGCRLRRCKCEDYQEVPSSNPACKACRDNAEECVFSMPERKRGPIKRSSQDYYSIDNEPGTSGRQMSQIVGPVEKSPAITSTPVTTGPAGDTFQHRRTDLHGIPTTLVDQLLAVYFTHIHNVWPLIFKPLFNPHKTPAYLLLSMLAVASCVAPAVTRDRMDFEGLFKLAEDALQRRGTQSRIDIIQSLILLSLRQTGCGDKWSAASYAGRASMMCLTLGLNLNSNTIDDTSEKDIRSRVFWNCYVLDKSIAEETGRPFLLPYRRSSIPFPSIFESDELETWPPLPLSSVPMPPSVQNLTPRRSYVLSCFVWTCRLAMLIEDILDLEVEGPNLEHSDVAWDTNFLRETKERREKSMDIEGISRQIDAWKDGLPKALNVDFERNVSPLPHHVVNVAWYHTAKILLYSRSLRRHQSATGVPPVSTASSAPMDVSSLSHRVCSQAAQAVVNLLGLLDQYQLLQQASSDVIHLLSLATLFEAYDSTSNNPDLAMISRTNFSRCCEWLRDFSSSWPAASSHKVFFEGLIRGGLQLLSSEIDQETYTSNPEGKSPSMPEGLRTIRRHLTEGRVEERAAHLPLPSMGSPSSNLSNLIQLPRYYWNHLTNPPNTIDRPQYIPLDATNHATASAFLPSSHPGVMLSSSFAPLDTGDGANLPDLSRSDTTDMRNPLLADDATPFKGWPSNIAFPGEGDTSHNDRVERSLETNEVDQSAVYGALMTYIMEAARSSS